MTNANGSQIIFSKWRICIFIKLIILPFIKFYEASRQNGANNKPPPMVSEGVSIFFAARRNYCVIGEPET